MARIKKQLYEVQREWSDKLSRAKRVRNHWSELFHVKLSREYLDGKQNPGAPHEDWITVNKMYSYAKAQLPTLYSADPYFYVKLKKSYNPNPMLIALWETRGKIRSAMLNHLKDELCLKDKVRLSIQDSLTSYGVVKTHYQADIVENRNAGQPIYSSDGSELFDDMGNMLLEPETIPMNQRYHITRVHPDDFLWDEDAGPLEDDWNWVAQRVRKPLWELKRDARYNNTALKKLESSGSPTSEEEQEREDRKKGGDIRGRSENARSEKQKTKKDDEIIAFWEIYKIKEKTWLVVAEDGEIPLMEEQPIPPGIEKHPFSILIFTKRDDSAYPIPPFSQGIDPCKEYNRARSDIQKHRKRFNRKYEVNVQAFADDDIEISKLETGDDGTILKKRTGEQAIIPVPEAQLDPLRYQELNFLLAEMNDLFGMNTGETNQIARADSATQAGILDRRLEVKEGDSLSIVVDFVCSIARKLDQLVQTHITQDEAIKVSGPQGDYWQLVRMADYDEIEGEYAYSVNVGATMPRLPHIERSSWMAFLGIVASFPHLLLSKRLFVKMAEMHHIEDELMVEELFQIGNKIMSGQLPMPGQSGSQAGVGETRPVSAAGGMSGGIQSLTTGNAAINQ